METYQEKSYDPADHYGGIKMEPNTIEENISRLMDSIKESAEYQEFQKQNEILKQNPELKSRVDAFRAENYRVQNECDADNLFDVVEQMGRESAELRRHPEVNAYLDAELALCRMMQRICVKLTEGVEMDVPGALL